MKLSVDLQDPYSYMILWVILAGALFLAVLVAQIIFRKKNPKPKKEKKKKPPKIKTPPKKTLMQLKQTYAAELANLEYRVATQKVTIRAAYQEMSLIIRKFVAEATGIRVDDYTLEEISRLRMPILYSLVQEYYEPEFAKYAISDVQNSIKKTRRAILGWY